MAVTVVKGLSALNIAFCVIVSACMAVGDGTSGKARAIPLVQLSCTLTSQCLEPIFLHKLFSTYFSHCLS